MPPLGPKYSCLLEEVEDDPVAIPRPTSSRAGRTVWNAPMNNLDASDGPSSSQAYRQAFCSEVNTHKKSFGATCALCALLFIT